MIINIAKIICLQRRVSVRLASSFSDKAEILKTYLEIIPPHRIYELKEKK